MKPLLQLNLFVLFAENSQILLKISIIPILVTSMYVSGSTKSSSKQPTQLNVELNSSFWHIIITMLSIFPFAVSSYFAEFNKHTYCISPRRYLLIC